MCCIVHSCITCCVNVSCSACIYRAQSSDLAHTFQGQIWTRFWHFSGESPYSYSRRPLLARQRRVPACIVYRPSRFRTPLPPRVGMRNSPSQVVSPAPFGWPTTFVSVY